jgi:D-3-phosphoglycerate dehydrogenase
MKPIVYNLEPFYYSPNAEEMWISKGFKYVGGSLDELIKFQNTNLIEILITRLRYSLDESILYLLPNLKAIITATTGLDHIDKSVLDNKKVQTYSLRPHKDFLDTIPSTAEHTWALMMALLRNIPNANTDVTKGNWERDRYRGYQLKGKTIGIIGLGRTGTKVAHYANSFNMEVVYYDPNVFNGEWNKVDSLNELAKRADIVTVHVHLLQDTINLIDNLFIENCKDNVFIINTSRGKVCDELAIVSGLNKSKIKGVATDVLSCELTNITDSHLWRAQQEGANVIITPHLGGATWEAMWDCEEYLARCYDSNNL